MNALGPALITQPQQRAMMAGAETLDILRHAVYPAAAACARVGRVWWVREPYQLLRKKSGLGEAIVFGHSPLDHKLPEGFGLVGGGGQLNANYRSFRDNGAGLRREESRATLEITEVLPGAAGWRCKVHMQQVDAFLEQRGAA